MPYYFCCRTAARVARSGMYPRDLLGLLSWRKETRGCWPAGGTAAGSFSRRAKTAADGTRFDFLFAAFYGRNARTTASKHTHRHSQSPMSQTRSTGLP